MHRGLNADFVFQWFKFLSLEVGARMEILRSSNKEHVGAWPWDNVVKPLSRLHRMWLTQKEVDEAFGDFVFYGFERSIPLMDVTYQADGCKACILARVGSNINTLCALKCLIKSRITLESHAKHPNRLRLLRLVDAWIELWRGRYALDEGHDRRILQDSFITGQAEELYEKREEIKLEHHRIRRAQRRNLETQHSSSREYKQYVKGLEEEEFQNTLHDAENDIIDSYAALRQSQRASILLTTDLTANKLSNHTRPAYTQERKAAKGDRLDRTPTTARGNTNPHPERPKKTPAYRESRYSVNSIRNEEQVRLGREAALAVLEAAETSPADLRSPRSAVAKDSGRNSQATVWPVRTSGDRVEIRNHTTSTNPNPKPREPSIYRKGLATEVDVATRRSNTSHRSGSKKSHSSHRDLNTANMSQSELEGVYRSSVDSYLNPIGPSAPSEYTYMSFDDSSTISAPSTRGATLGRKGTASSVSSLYSDDRPGDSVKKGKTGRYERPRVSSSGWERSRSSKLFDGRGFGGRR
ncbi:hypothetical protein LTR64_006659 [Lithohypha guttulata]|uniref:uncharacterized protein n=1 Tax=Lithohypha guttulata TaxID=1690604 RepID=UPI002DDDC847|nr:hypothetical protein LTR51_004782 [Lithohypha guttulata]